MEIWIEGCVSEPMVVHVLLANQDIVTPFLDQSALEKKNQSAMQARSINVSSALPFQFSSFIDYFLQDGSY